MERQGGKGIRKTCEREREARVQRGCSGRARGQLQLV